MGVRSAASLSLMDNGSSAKTAVSSECFTKIIDLAMTTFYVLYDEFNRSYVRAGRLFGRRHFSLVESLNYASHFTSIWSASNTAKKCTLLGCLTVKRIVLQ